MHSRARRPGGTSAKSIPGFCGFCGRDNRWIDRYIDSLIDRQTDNKTDRQIDI